MKTSGTSGSGFSRDDARYKSRRLTPSANIALSGNYADRNRYSAHAQLPECRALILLLRFHGIAVDAEQLAHQYGRTIGTTEMLRCAKELKLKARAIESNWERLAKTALPAIAERNDGSFIIVGKVADESVLILDPAVGRPQSLDRARIRGAMERAARADDAPGRAWRLARRFDITWFLQAMHKYRRIARRGADRLVLPAAFCARSRRCFSRSSSTRCWCIRA